MDTSIVTRKPKKTCVDCGTPVANYYAKRCRRCMGLARRNAVPRRLPADYHALAAQRGFEWIGPEVRLVSQKTGWRCAKGHEWQARYSGLQGCPYCNRHTPEDYHALAASKGYIWLGPEVATTSAVTSWQCGKGHVWRACYSTVQKGRTCAECKRLHDEDYHAMAAARGIRWVGIRGRTSKVPTEWECPEGHRWFASYNNISKGTSCPGCLDYVNGVRVSKQQRALADMVGGELNYKVGRYSVDVAIFRAGIKIACEYDSHYWHGGRLEDDQKRARRLVAQGWKVLAIKSRRRLPDIEQLDLAITELLNGTDYQKIVLDDWGEGPTYGN